MCFGFSLGPWSSPQKCCSVQGLTAQASGRGLIRGCKSSGSAFHSASSLYRHLSHSLILHSSSPLCLSAACRFVSSPSPLPQDLLLPSFHQRKTSPLSLHGNAGCFHEVEFHYSVWLCILINSVCVCWSVC